MAKATTNPDESVARTYFEIEPAAEAADPARLQDAFRRLHKQRRSFQLECLVVARDGGVSYYLGTETENARILDHTLHSVFPDDSTISNPDTDPAALLEELAPTSDQDTNTDTDTDEQQPDEQGSPNRSAPSTETPDRSQPPAGAVRYRSRGNRRRDWQMQLQEAVEPDRETIRSPLTGVVDTFADVPDETVAVYQALLEPHEDWRVDEGLRRESLEMVDDTFGQRISRFLFGPYEYDDREELPRSNRRRLEELNDADPAKAWTVDARAYVQGPAADGVAHDLTDAFGSLDGDFYRVDVVRESGDDARDVLEAMCDRTLRSDYGRLKRLTRRFPWTPNTRPAVVTDPTTAPAFCYLDGDALTHAGRQALDVTDGEKAGVTPPTDEQLEVYDTAGLTLGRLLDADDERTDTTIALPPEFQTLHVLWSGKTGSGKTVSQHIGMFDNLEATNGPEIILANKGDGMAEDFLKPYYLQYGDLEDVHYFE